MSEQPAEYLARLRAAAVTHPLVNRIVVLRERRSKSDGYIRAVLTFVDGSRLETVEYVRLEPEEGLQVERYSYRWMDADNNLLTRWDNAPHYRHLPGFPHHRHEGDERNIVPGEPMSLFAVLDLIAARINP